MTKYQENFIYATSFIKKLSKMKMVTLLLGHPVPQLARSKEDTKSLKQLKQDPCSEIEQLNH